MAAAILTAWFHPRSSMYVHTFILEQIFNTHKTMAAVFFNNVFF